MKKVTKKNKFNTGSLNITRDVLEKMRADPSFSTFVINSFWAHATGDWGRLSPRDIRANEWATCKDNVGLISRYLYKDSEVLVATMPGRTSTVIMMQAEQELCTRSAQERPGLSLA